MKRAIVDFVAMLCMVACAAAFSAWMIMASQDFLTPTKVLEVYTPIDVYYVDIDELRVTSETGDVTKDFKTQVELIDWLGDLTASHSHIQNYEIPYMLKYATVYHYDDCQIGISLRNPDSDMDFYQLVNHIDTLDNGLTLQWWDND